MAKRNPEPSFVVDGVEYASFETAAKNAVLKSRGRKVNIDVLLGDNIVERWTVAANAKLYQGRYR